MASFVVPDACTRLFFHNDAVLNTTISAAELKPGTNDRTYAYSPDGHAVAHIGFLISPNGTKRTPEMALQSLYNSLEAACSFRFDQPFYPIAWTPSFGDQPFPVSSIIMSAGGQSFISLLDRKEGYLSNNPFTAYPGCYYKTSDPQIRANGTSITPANLTEVRPKAFNTTMSVLAKLHFSEGYTAKYSVVLAPGGLSASPQFSIEVAASNLTSSMDLQKEAWLCFQKMYSSYMSKNETPSYYCKTDFDKTLPTGWIAHWPCYTGNQKNDTQGHYCACQVDTAVQKSSSAASAQSSVIIGVLSLLMLSVFV
ncbi:hypothetical protein HDU80_004756 [Chytriomyces hyalinus]|nr:hypothetical protein HDU80_004756 [Chytriomyces hyalinus]